MKLIKLILGLITGSIMLFSCIKKNDITSGGGVIGGTPASFVLNASGGNCSNITVQGTYKKGVALGTSNKVIAEVNVVTIGSYNISTTVTNGMTFKATGSFSSTGTQTVTLQGSGTPLLDGNIVIPISAGGTSCNFTVTVAPPDPPAAFTLVGAPGACGSANIQGTYYSGTDLVASNKVGIQVNVTTAGAYSITTDTVNGMYFNAAGSFTSTGTQTVTLEGHGTPVSAATSTLTPKITGSSCTFDVTVLAAITDKISCKIDGVFTTFYENAEAIYIVPGDLVISGDASLSTSESFLLGIDKASSGGTSVSAGTYVNTLAGTLAGGYLLNANYTDLSSSIWAPKGVIDPSPDPFTIIITSITATRVKGTFSGTVRNNAGTSTKTITEGLFDVPIN